MGPVGPRWAPCWPHGPCYGGCVIYGFGNSFGKTDNLSFIDLQPILLTFRTVEFYSVSLRIVAHNAKTRFATCVSDSPLLVMTHRSDKAIGTFTCRPFCGPTVTCTVTEVTPLDVDYDEHIMECTCSPSICKGLAIQISAGAMLDQSHALRICHVQAHFRLYTPTTHSTCQTTL